MSFNDVYEFIQGEYQQVERIRQEPVSTADPTFFKDLNLVKWAGFSIEIWSAETGGTQLVQGLDYELQYLDVAASGPAGEPVYSGYSILTPLYYNIPLFQTAAVVGAYTTRPYRPSYNVITTDTTVTPVSMDDSVIADASAGNFTITLADGFHLNQRYSVVCKGTGTVTVVGTGIGAGAAFQGVGVSWLWDGGEWMPLAVPGARDGGFYYNYVPAFIRPDTDPISDTIPNFLATYGEGFFYIGLEFTYNGVTDKTNGTFAIADDDIDKYAVLAVDIAGGDSTLSIQWQWATDTMVAIERGTDFTDLNLWAVFRWEKVTYGGYGAWANTAEAPTYGDPIVSGQELYLDGTKEFVSSDGNKPVVDVVDYLPAVINVDGAETPELNSKWLGQRGTYGFFGEYENVSTGAIGEVSATTSQEGSWLKVLATATGGQAQITFTALSTIGYTTCLIKRGNTSISQVQVSPSGNGYVSIDWGLHTITGLNGAISTSFFISDEIACVKFLRSAAGGVALILPAGNGGATATDDYTYFMDWMVADLPYAVPYTAGTHQPSKLQFNKDWAESTEWTIQGWVNPVTENDASQIIIKASNSSSDTPRFQLYRDITLLWSTFVNSGGASGASTAWTVQPPGDGYWHCKMTLSPTALDVYVNGVLASNVTVNIPNTAEIGKQFFLGSSNLFTEQFMGYMSHWTIQPGIDTSDAHYLSGLPWYSPDKTYGKNASWSIDSRGNISGNNQVSGAIIFDGEINGQWVTRWAGGRMQITTDRRIITQSLTITIPSGALFENDSSQPEANILYSTSFIGEPPSVTVSPESGSTGLVTAYAASSTISGFQLKAFMVSARTTSIGITFIATGRWK